MKQKKTMKLCEQSNKSVLLFLLFSYSIQYSLKWKRRWSAKSLLYFICPWVEMEVFLEWSGSCLKIVNVNQFGGFVNNLKDTIEPFLWIMFPF